MKEGRSVAEIKAELLRQQQSKRDFDVPTTILSLVYQANQFGFNVPNKGIFPLTDLCHSHLATKINIPKNYYDRMREKQPQLLLDNVNTWLKTEPKNVYLRCLDNKARALMSSGYKPMDAFPLAKVAFAYFEKIEGCTMSLDITERYFRMKVIKAEQEFALAGIGDRVSLGIEVGTSEVGCSPYYMAPFSMIKSCHNGAKHNEYADRAVHLGKRHGTTDVREWDSDTTRTLEDLTWLSRFKDGLEHFFSSKIFDEIIAKFVRSRGIELLEAPKEVIEVFTNKYSWNEQESDLVLEHYIRSNDKTAYGLANAITRASQDLDSYDRASEFEEIGGEVINLDIGDWEKIAA